MNGIIKDILEELKKAKKKFPSWPVHIVSRAAIVNEEAGELIRAALQFKYEKKRGPEQMEEMRKEAIQIAAMAIRFIESLNKSNVTTATEEKENSVVGEAAGDQRGDAGLHSEALNGDEPGSDVEAHRPGA